MGILVDTAYGARNLHALEPAVTGFLRRVLKKDDRVFLVGFDTSSDLVVDFTNDAGALAKGMLGLRGGSGAMLYDAVFYACWDKLRAFPQGEFERALVIVSDGQDAQSRVAPRQALEIAQRIQVRLFSIATPGTIRNPAVLRLAEQTGGLNASSFEAIAEEFEHQYLLLYQPKPFAPDGGVHEVNIKPHRSELSVRAPKGYYAPSP